MWAGELFDLLQYIRRVLGVRMLGMPGRSDRLETHTVKNLRIQIVNEKNTNKYDCRVLLL